MTLHLVHDTPLKEESLPRLPCVRLHGFNGVKNDVSEMQIRYRAAATDRRWALYAHVLDDLRR